MQAECPKCCPPSYKTTIKSKKAKKGKEIGKRERSAGYWRQGSQEHMHENANEGEKAERLRKGLKEVVESGMDRLTTVCESSLRFLGARLG